MRVKRWRLRYLLLVCTIYFIIFNAVSLQAVRTAALTEEVPTVVIDAGHGGEDGGASTSSGVLESEINLSVAHRLEQVFALCGIRTCMIRTENVSVATQGDTVRERKRSDLAHRIQIVEETNDPILISIHQNHFDRSEYSGLQVFYRDDIKSKELAELLRSLYMSAVNSSSGRKCQKAESVYIMQKVSCTAILVECGFLSNPQEALLLQDASYQTKLSCVISAALTQFIEKGENEIEI